MSVSIPRRTPCPSPIMDYLVVSTRTLPYRRSDSLYLERLPVKSTCEQYSGPEFRLGSDHRKAMLHHPILKCTSSRSFSTLIPDPDCMDLFYLISQARRTVNSIVERNVPRRPPRCPVRIYDSIIAPELSGLTLSMSAGEETQRYFRCALYLFHFMWAAPDH